MNVNFDEQALPSNNKILKAVKVKEGQWRSVEVSGGQWRSVELREKVCAQLHQLAMF